MDHPPLSDQMKEDPKGLTSELAFLSGGGEMRERIRAFDWSGTPIGPIQQWPQSLKTIVRTMLDSRYAMWMGWGPEVSFFYNDAYRRDTLGTKHPWALGHPAHVVWAEIWLDIGPRVDHVLSTGEATWDEGCLLFLERSGYSEETYHTFSYSPLYTEAGAMGGMLCVVTEETERVVAERRVACLRDLASSLTTAKTEKEIFDSIEPGLTAGRRDLPFTLTYLYGEDGELRLAAQTGIAAGHPAMTIEALSGWPLEDMRSRGAPIIVDDLARRFEWVPPGPWQKSPTHAMLLPIAQQGQTRPVGFFLAGITPHRPLDDAYQGFVHLVVGQIAAAIANVRAYEEERQRAEALAELDRAKTAFFSNVSHEFRTPLTLMLGPVEELLVKSHTDLSPAAKGQLEIVNRNGLRLLRLVNNLLDFSRVEAGRVQAVYEPTDLASFTAELASCFRSATERAGIALVVDCLPLSEAVYVDRDMWEKIVLNLLSNAFKFTFEGEIGVALREGEQTVELRVRDTGVGIPGQELTHLFERFHRIENMRSRTHEGSGIGLALVLELVKLHSGSVRVESRSGEGSTFIVTVPKGSAHLPAKKISARRSMVSTSMGAVPFVEEALRWLPDEQSSHMVDELPEQQELLAVSCPPTADDLLGDRPCILVADDNADMRQYVGRLLRERYVIEAVPDGEAALAAVRKRRPDLILTDVMMPRLDGFGLLRELRADAGTKTIPVILLSARAGEESRVEGLEHGADDYLIKPFSARELLARVSAHLDMARLRREAGEALRQSEERFARFMQHLPGLAWIKDEQGRYVYANDAAQKTFHSPKERLYGKTDEEIFAAEVAAQFRENDRRVLAGGTGVQVVETLEHQDGLLHHSLVSKFPIPGPDGQTTLVGGMAIDITERKQADEALRKAKERFDIVSDAAEVGFWFCDLPFDELIWDHRVKEHFWLPPDANVTIHIFYERLHPDDRERTRQAIEKSIANKTRYDIEYRTLSLEGEEKWIRAIGRTFYDEHEKPIRFDGVTLDITERKRAEERLAQFAAELEQRVAERTYDLAQSEDRLRTLATELNLAEQRERKRLAMELHDHLQQMLVLGRITIGQGKRMAAGVPAYEQVLKKVDDIFSDALAYTRTLVSDLSPTVLRDHGLAAALQWLGTYMQKYNQTVTVTVPEDEDLKLPEDQVILLFQSVRELLINSSKHARTGEATVRMEQRDGLLRMDVRDEGAGFDLAAAGTPSGGISSKFGLFSIRERMRALGGSFEIESALGKGTTATLVLPLRPPHDAARLAERRDGS